MAKISVVINTLNEAKSIETALKSVSWADEVIICDMHSEDETAAVAKKMGARVILHKREDFVERARNFAVSQAANEWVLVIDPDEQIPETLAERLLGIANKTNQIDYVKIPRKNIIFDKWMQASMWWPDLNIRFFKKDKVRWGNRIHIQPEAEGEGLELPGEEKWAIVHNHYATLGEYLERMLRYTKIQAEELLKDGYKFDWKDLIKKPLGEFLGRFFANSGFRDGLHGLVLSLLQAFSFLIVYIRVWELQKFKPQTVSLPELKEECGRAGDEIGHWFKVSALSPNTFKRFFQKLKNKL